MKILKLTAVLFIFILVGYSMSAIFVLASETNGTIDSISKYAWGENIGWIDFGASQGAVAVTDSALTGYAWSETAGWISLNCSNTSSCATVDYKVSNDNEGALSGYAYGENIGWIQFNPAGGGVNIDSSGNFSGYAWGENTGWIVFNCSTTSSCDAVDYKVNTDWHPASSRSSGSSSGSRSRGFAPVSAPMLAEVVAPPANPISNMVSNVISSLIPPFLKPKPKIEPPKELPLEETLPKIAPLVFSNKLNLISAVAVGRFALAPLPDEIIVLAKKFPELDKTLNKLGITKISDLNKLQNAKFVLPGLSQNAGIQNGAGLSLSSMTVKQRQAFPPDIVFAKAGDLIDYNIHVAITDEGNPEQIISTIAGKTLDLIVKVDKPAKNVKGYLAVKKLDRLLGRKNVPATSAMAAAVLSALGASRPAKENIVIEQKMVLDEFEYEDKNNDGIYTARIQAPLVHGEYEVISIIEYKDATYGKKELRLTAVVDPEGYIYEKNGNKETRIPEAKVSLLLKDSKTGKFTLWPAKQYQQINPQKTDKSGTYSFLVPEGTYKLTVSAAGYYDFAEAEFDVNEGRGVHENIALRPRNWFQRLLDLLF